VLLAASTRLLVLAPVLAFISSFIPSVIAPLISSVFLGRGGHHRLAIPLPVAAAPFIPLAVRMSTSSICLLADRLFFLGQTASLFLVLVVLG
jgi:hypothetical protein